MTTFEDALNARNKGTSNTFNVIGSGSGATGPTGPTGPTGTAGADGLSAYEVAVANGFIGTEVEWLASLEGQQGIQGIQGLPGADGIDGSNGVGVPTGGTAGQVLAKVDGTDYNTTWVNQQGGQGGTGTTNSIELYVLNLNTYTINKGQVVYINGSDGNNITVALAQANTESTSSKTVGIAKENIPPNSHGYVVTEGVLEGLDTSGLTAGSSMWLSATVAGGIVYNSNRPSSPNHIVYLGVVERIQQNNGSVYVKIQNGFELDELHNVDLKTTAPVNDDVLTFNNNQWYPKSIENVYLTVINGYSQTLYKGQVVYIVGSNSTYPTIYPFTTFNDSTIYGQGSIGILYQDLNTNSVGKIIIQGKLSGIYTQNLQEGGPIYSSMNGGLSSTPTPFSPNVVHNIYVGLCIKRSTTVGEIYVNIQNGFDLEELHNVGISSPVSGNVLEYDGTTSLWKNVADYIKRTVANIFTAPQTFSTTGSNIPITIDASNVTTGTPLFKATTAAGDVTISKYGTLDVPTVKTNGFRMDINSTLVGYTLNKNWIGIANTPTVPLQSMTISGGGMMYAYNDQLWFRGSDGVNRNLSAPDSLYPIVSTVTITTASLADLANEKSTIDIAKGYRLLSITIDKGARVRLYSTTTGRDADESRIAGVDPEDSVGCMFEYRNTVASAIDLTPTVDGFVNSGVSIPYTIQNLSGSTGTVTVTFTYVRTI